MKEKIAVHCPTESLWEKVQKEAIHKGNRWNASGKIILTFEAFLKDVKTVTISDFPEMCIFVSGGSMRANTRERFSSGDHPVGKCKIISAQEFLKEGEVEEFKVGDRVECVIRRTGVRVGSKGKVCHIASMDPPIGIEWDEAIGIHSCNGHARTGYGFYMEPEEIKSINNSIKPKSKESNMNVNSTVAKVFKDVDDAIMVTRYLGKEYEEGNHRAYLDLKGNSKVVLAEAKRLELEEKVK